MKKKYQKSSTNIKTLEASLKKRIFGQDYIIEEVVNTLYINMAGLGDDSKPIASFLLTGPTGVGKTELAKELAKLLGIHFERFDMSEYADDSSVRNLTGGSKGLVGYEEGGLLTNAINENPHCVLLLDEIEKADQSIYNTFLQVLDYGTLTDTKGGKTDFTNTIIIMTSNLGSNEKRGIGFGSSSSVYKESAVADFLTPEFRNRIDKMLEFNKLTKDMVMNITDKFLDDFSKTLLKKNISLTVSNEAKEVLNYIGFDANMGARSVMRAINNEFKRKISREILFGKLSSGGKVVIDIEDGRFIYLYSIAEKESDDIDHFEALLDEHDSEQYDFETAQEAFAYAKANVGTVITRASAGYGYIIKK